jgi:hypothetical protein
MSPGGARFAIDEPAIEGVAELRSKRGDPIEAHASTGRRECGRKSRSGGKDKRGVHVVLYGSPRDVSFDAQDPLRVDLVVEPDLAAAEKAATAAISPPYTQMTAGIESGPVIYEGDWRRGRPVGRRALNRRRRPADVDARIAVAKPSVTNLHALISFTLR